MLLVIISDNYCIWLCCSLSTLTPDIVDGWWNFLLIFSCALTRRDRILCLIFHARRSEHNLGAVFTSTFFAPRRGLLPQVLRRVVLHKRHQGRRAGRVRVPALRPPQLRRPKSVCKLDLQSTAELPLKRSAHIERHLLTDWRVDIPGHAPRQRMKKL